MPLLFSSSHNIGLPGFSSPLSSPHWMPPKDGERDGLWFRMEKSGLDDIRPIVHEDGGDYDSESED